MLRLIFVTLIVGAGFAGSLFDPFYALLFYLWNAYFRPEHWTYGGLIESLRLSLTIGIVLLVRTAMAAPRLPLNGRTALLALFLGQVLFATVMSEQPDASWAFVPDFIKVLIIAYLVVVLADDVRKVRLAVLTIALALGFEGAKQGWATTILHPGAKNSNGLPFLGDNNGVALGMMMLVPLFNALAASATRRWERLGHRFMAIGVFLRGITTYSRGGFLAAGVVGVLMLTRSRHKVRALIGIAAVVYVVTSVMPDSFWNRMDTITASDDERDASAAGRLHFWRVATSMANARPLYGVGPDGFKGSYTTYEPSEALGAPATHSTWFGALAELGYPGLLLLIGNIIAAMFACWRVARITTHDSDDEQLSILANGVMTSLAAFVVAGTFLSQQYSEMLWHFIGLSTAIGLAADRLKAEAPASAATTPRAVLTPAARMAAPSIAGRAFRPGP